MEAQTGMEDIGGSNTVGSQTASPTQLPTYIVSYWPTTDSPTEMEKGKSKKSPDQESDHKKNQDNGKTKGNEHTETTKDNQTKDVSVPLSESSWAPRQPYTSGRAPATSISRPSLTNNSTIAKSMSSMVPSDSLSALPSQLPTEKATSALSERPSQEPTGEKSGLEYNTTANTESTLSNETEHTEEKISDKTAKMSSGSKVSFSGVFPSSKIIDNSSDISISGKGKVSLSGARDAESKASSKIYISGVFPSSQNKNDAPSITIKGNGKVSFSRTKDDDSVTPVPTPTPTVTLSSGSNQRPTSSKISISGIFPSSKNKSNPSLSIGTNGRVSFGNNIEDDAENDASLVPTLTPMVSRPNNKTKPKSDGEKVKISWSIPSSHGKKKEENATSSTANILGLKPIQYYTDVPTSPAPSSAPEDGTGKEKRQEKKKKKNKSPSPTVITLTDEPTYFVYPTLSPSNVDSNDKNISANYPTYSPTYMPTKHAKERPSRPTFAFESASGRENNDIIIDSVTPQHSDTFNNTVSKNDNTAIEPANNTSGDRESDESEEEEDRKEHSTYLYQKRICPGFPLGVNPAVPKVEQEIFFTYGIETRGTSDFSLTQVVEELQIRILDDAAINILRCNDRRLWRRGRSIQSASPVSRVYYSRSTSISTLSKSDCMFPFARNILFTILSLSSLQANAHPPPQNQRIVLSLKVQYT